MLSKKWLIDNSITSLSGLVNSGNASISAIGDAYNKIKEQEGLTREQKDTLNNIFEKAKSEASDELSKEVLEKLGIDPNDESNNSIKEKSLYLDHSVGKNILDNYDVPTYKLKLFMRTKSSLKTSSTESSSTSEDDRKEQTPSTSKDSGIKLPNSEDIVILAETGSTDISIDNLNIKHVTKNNSLVPTTYNFTITEPGSVTLLDRIAAAKEHCGWENSPDVPYFLEVEFKGYKADIDDEDAGGEPVTIKGPYIFTLGGITFTMDISPQGAVYEFNAYESADMAKLDVFYRTRKQLKISGKNIRDILIGANEKSLSLQNLWNNSLKEEATDGKVADQIVINLDKLIQPDQSKTETEEGQEANVSVKSPDLLSNQFFKDDFKKEDFAARGYIVDDDATTSITTEDQTTNTITASDGQNDLVITTTTTISEESDPSSIKSKTIKNINQVTITIAEGSSFEEILSLVLSLSEDLFKRATRLLDANNLSGGVNRTQPFITWFNVDTDLIRSDTFDDKRNEYPKTIVFKPKLIKESRTDIGISIEELNLELTAEEVKKRINELKIFKEYRYMFSGKNDQIIDFNLRFNEAYALTHPGFGKGDFAQQSQMAIAPALQEKEAKNNKQTNAGPETKKEKQTKSGNILDKLKEIKEAGEDAFSKLVSDFGNNLGFTAQEIKDITNDLNSDKAQLLAQSLADERISDALVQNELVKKVTSPQTGSPTESDESTDTDSQNEQNYINFLYSSELIKGLEGDSLSESDAGTIVKAKLRNPKPKIEKNDTKNQVKEAPTERDSYRPSAFSHLMEKHSEASSNQIIRLTLRGDPWYLGANNFYDQTSEKDSTENANQDSSKTTETSLTAAQWSGGSVDFLIVLESPRKFDFNIDDEDQNTGLFDFSGINYTMSGVYHILNAETNFEGGLFTVDITASKDNDYDMSMIELAKSSASTTVDRLAKGTPEETDISYKDLSENPWDNPHYIGSGLYKGFDGTIFDESGAIIFSSGRTMK